MTGLQTGIYPVAGPGGWQLLGYALRAVYDPWREQPFLIALGRHRALRARGGRGAARARRRARCCRRSPSARPCAWTRPACSTSSSTAAATWAAASAWRRSGPADARAARLANALVGNDANEPLLELTVRGPSLTALRPGADRDRGPAVLPWIDGQPAEALATLELAAGDRLSLPHTGQGARSYLALAGGIESERFMGSASTDVRGLVGRPLAAGDVLGTAREVDSATRMSARVDWQVDGATVRILPGTAGHARGARAARRRRVARRRRRSHGRALRGRRDSRRRVGQRAAAARCGADHAQRRALRPARRPLSHGRLLEAGGRPSRRSADHRPAAAGHARALRARRARRCAGISEPHCASASTVVPMPASAMPTYWCGPQPLVQEHDPGHGAERRELPRHDGGDAHRAARSGERITDERRRIERSQREQAPDGRAPGQSHAAPQHDREEQRQRTETAAGHDRDGAEILGRGVEREHQPEAERGAEGRQRAGGGAPPARRGGQAAAAQRDREPAADERRRRARRTRTR